VPGPTITRTTFRTDLALPYVLLLGALTVPRVVAHDLRLIPIEGTVYTVLAIAPLLVWLIVAVFRKTSRPLFDFVVIGLAYGFLLALTHQILWDASWGTDVPHIGGNLAGKLNPIAESLILRAFAVGSSVVTGLVFGAAFGLVAVLAMKLRNRQPKKVEL
jgi:hypothetical protein